VELQIVEVIDMESDQNELFKKVIKGNKNLKIDDTQFEIDIKNDEALNVLQFYTIMFKNTNAEKPMSKKTVDNVTNIMRCVFQRSYPNIDEKILNDFLDSRFLDIVSGVAVACGWLQPEKIKKEINKNE
jgi:hypothetical protein